MNLTHDPVILETFAAAIARQAAEDYMDAYRYIIHHPRIPEGEKKKKEYYNHQKMLSECERFFYSEAFSVLCPTIDVEWFIRTLKTEVRYGKAKRRGYHVQTI